MARANSHQLLVSCKLSRESRRVDRGVCIEREHGTELLYGVFCICEVITNIRKEKGSTYSTTNFGKIKNS